MGSPRFLWTAMAMVVLCATSSWAQSTPPAPALTPTPTPAPAPAPEYVNLTDLLTVAGPFHTFLNYLITTKVIDIFQNQANDTVQGITVFVPKDTAFTPSITESLRNYTADQLKSLMLFHALPRFYSLSDFKSLSLSSPVNTMAGGGLYSINFTDSTGVIHLNSGWSRTVVSSSVHSTDPVAVYQVDKVLLPQAILGTDFPPMPAPAPAPVVAPSADSPTSDADGGGRSPAKSPPGSGSSRVGAWSQLVLGASGVIGMFML